MKILRTSLWLLVFLLFVVRPVLAQTTVTAGPITTNDKVEWTVSGNDAPSPIAAQALIFRLYVDSSPTPIAYQAVGGGCVGASQPPGAYICSTNVTQPLANLVNVKGSHSLVGSLFDPATGIEGPRDLPFILPTGPGAPLGHRITR